MPKNLFNCVFDACFAHKMRTNYCCIINDFVMPSPISEKNTVSIIEFSGFQG